MLPLLAFRYLWCCTEDSGDGGPDLFCFLLHTVIIFLDPHSSFVRCPLPSSASTSHQFLLFSRTFSSITCAFFLLQQLHFRQHHLRILLAPIATVPIPSKKSCLISDNLLPPALQHMPNPNVRSCAVRFSYSHVKGLLSTRSFNLASSSSPRRVAPDNCALHHPKLRSHSCFS